MPWDTLRRLLGLPADMEAPGPEDLVRLAIDEPRRARLIALALGGHPPREGPVGLVLGAVDRGAVEPDLAAELLGAIGHGAGYGAVRALLFEDAGAARPAGVAMARILGKRAAADLTLALHGADARESREAAAMGLAEVGDADAAAGILEAGVEGRIRARVAARCAIRLGRDVADWLDCLTDRRIEARRLGTDIVYVLLLSDDPSARVKLQVLDAAGAKDLVRVALTDPELYMLHDKREALATWVG